jgi:hypothetical protein
MSADGMTKLPVVVLSGGGRKVPARRPLPRGASSFLGAGQRDGRGELLQHFGALGLGTTTLGSKPDDGLPQGLEFRIGERLRLVQGPSVPMVAGIKHPIRDELFQGQLFTRHPGKTEGTRDDPS